MTRIKGENSKKGRVLFFFFFLEKNLAGIGNTYRMLSFLCIFFAVFFFFFRWLCCDSDICHGLYLKNNKKKRVFPISPGNSAYHLAQSHNGRKKRRKKIKIVVWPENKAKRSCVCQILLQEVEKRGGEKGGKWVVLSVEKTHAAKRESSL